MTEQRTSPRRHTFKVGTILFGWATAVECVVRNLSATGACIEVASSAGIPGEFALRIKREIPKRECRVAWRSKRRIGVRFK